MERERERERGGDEEGEGEGEGEGGGSRDRPGRHGRVMYGETFGHALYIGHATRRAWGEREEWALK